MANDATPQRLYLLRVATMGDEHESVPIPCYLIRLGDGTDILIDSGLPEGAESWPGMRIAIDRGVVGQLAGLGLGPEEIDVVICSHLDPDHAGQHLAFANAEFVLQRAHDARARQGGERFAAAQPFLASTAVRTRLVDGDTELFPGVELIASGGHTAGHQSVLVRLPGTGPVLLAIDAIGFDLAGHTPETAPLGPYVDDEAEARASIHKLLDLAERERVALIIRGHDAAQWETLKLAPDYYE